MKGFESFDLRTWLTDGFTHHVAGEGVTPSHKPRSSRRKTIVAFSLVAAAAFVNQIPAPAAAAQTSYAWPQQPLATSFDRDSIASPEQYWPSIIREIADWEDVEESPLEDPPTLL